MSIIKLAIDNQLSKFQQLSNAIHNLSLKPKVIKTKDCIGSQEMVVSNSMMTNPTQSDHAWGKDEHN